MESSRVHVLGVQHSASDELVAVCASRGSAGQEDAFYLCDLDDIVRKVRLWRRLLPRVRPHYAVKCNASRAVLNTLAALGTGFDCASKGEIAEVLSMGVEPGRVIFAHPAKPASHIRYAASRGVNLTTFDSEDELYKIRALHPTCKLVLRIRSDAEDAMVCLGVKYGCDAQRDAPRLLAAARDLGLQVVGVSFHVGSGCREPLAYRSAVRAARHVFDLARDLGVHMNLLDLGGGFPGDNEATFTKMAEVLNESVSETFPSSSWPDLDVIAEPGCYLVATAFTLAANVHSRREVRDDQGGLLSVMYYINDGLYGSFFDVLQHRRFRGEPLQPPRDADLVPSSVWGPTCDGLDRVEEEALLPRLELGSWLLYRDAGAYTLAMASTFNSFPIAKVHAVASTPTWLLLRECVPFSETDFVPCLASGHQLSSAFLVDSSRRPSLQPMDSQAMGTSFPPNHCRRSSIIDQADMASSRPIY